MPSQNKFLDQGRMLLFVLGICFLPLYFAYATDDTFIQIQTYNDYKVMADKYLRGAAPVSEEIWKQDPLRYNSVVEAAYSAATITGTNSSTRLDMVAVLNPDDEFEARAKGMEREWMSGHDFNIAAQSGMRGSGFLYAGGAQDEANELRDTSESLNTAGKVGQVTTYAGYAAGAASIGAAALNYLNRKTGPSETAAKVSTLASYASFGVGIANMSTGAYGWWISRDYQKQGIDKANELQKDLDPNNPAQEKQYRELNAAKSDFEKARQTSNKAAVNMLFNGAVNFAVGGAAIAVGKQVDANNQNMNSLDSKNNNSDSELRTSDQSGTTATSSGSAAGSGTSVGSSAGGSTGTENGTEHGARILGNGLLIASLTTPGEAANANKTSANSTDTPSTPGLGLSGASVAPSDKAGNNSAATAPHAGAPLAGGAGLGANAKPGNSDENANTTAATSDSEMQAQISQAQDPLAKDVAYGSGSGKLSLSGSRSSDEEQNPIASVFGQLGQMMGGDKEAPTSDRNIITVRSVAATKEAKIPFVVHAENTDIFEVVKKKMFLMKYRGNL